MSVIEIKNITKDYGNNKGVFNVSFNVEKGQIMGFLGPNGAGKTTTIRQLMGFIKPGSGTVSINGLSCFENSAEIQKSLGYLPGEIAFLDDMTGIDFIRFIANMKGLKNFDYAKELMAFFELDASGKIKKMSKGMKQKIGIVCAFMQKPDILILDEPTSGLDPLMQNKFIELLLKTKERGSTVLMSSHIFEEVERTCDNTAIIRQGKIVAVESISALKQSRHRIYSIRLNSNEDAIAFAKSAQIDPKYINQNIVTAKVKDIDAFIKLVASFKVLDFEMHTETLEDLFMHFYGGDK